MNADLEKKTLIVIIPAYNEETTIAKTLSGLEGIKEDLEAKGFLLKLYVVNDGSADNTKAVATQAGADRVISHNTNRGLGAAVRTGLTMAQKDGASIAVKFDADLQHEPKDILALIEPILSDEADVVYGYRFGNLTYSMPFVRWVGNKVFTSLMRWLTNWNIRDAQPGTFAVDRIYLNDFRIPGDYNYTQQILLDAYHKGMRFAHAPVTFNKREAGSSFITLKYPFRVLYQILMVLVGVRPMRVFGSFGLICVGSASLTALFQLILYFWGLSERPIENVNLVMGLGLFGVQCLFFGILAQLIIEKR